MASYLLMHTQYNISSMQL